MVELRRHGDEVHGLQRKALDSEEAEKEELRLHDGGLLVELHEQHCATWRTCGPATERETVTAVAMSATAVDRVAGVVAFPLQQSSRWG